MTVNVTLRSTKGQPLTNAEMDANFYNLATAVDTALSQSTDASPATASSLGGIIVGSGLSITTGGILSVIPSAGTTYTLPPATTSALGGVKIGSGLFVDGTGTLSAVTGSSYVLPTASPSVMGGVKVGSGLAIDGAGTLSANAYALPVASAGVLGGVKVGAGIDVDSGGVISTSGLRVLAAVTFDTSGTIRKSYNVSTVTFTQWGQWTVTFTTPMPDAYYHVSGSPAVSEGTGQSADVPIYTGIAYDAVRKTVNYVVIIAPTNGGLSHSSGWDNNRGASITIFG